FKRIFTCLLSVDGNQEEIMGSFKETTRHANELGMEVMVDIAPRIFQKLGISYNDLSFFHELGAYGIRLDLGFTGNEESIMTYNPYGLKIEVNMSSGTKYIDNLLSYQPNRENLIGSHNFYPHRYAGLSYPHFLKCSQQFRDLGIRTAAFVNSQSATFGPWPIVEGLCTLEMHRELPIQVQAKHLYKTGLIDDVIIANAYASEAELKALSLTTSEPISFEVELFETITPLEKKIVLEEFHFYRGDVSDYLIRSTQSRVKYKNEEFKPTYTPDIRRGDLLIENELYGQYKGELQIALQDMKNSGKTNVVGRIKPEELFLLDYLQPWDKFAFSLFE
ncbi:MAG TPA: MupG family TIM beta-alpha barrel fold protein, partial [Pseudoneobacillus sp.]|nr:MupG family TIM beta-alpha barrel fold protein [Pseudoneobacillus sp.]